MAALKKFLRKLHSRYWLLYALCIAFSFYVVVEINYLSVKPRLKENRQELASTLIVAMKDPSDEPSLPLVEKLDFIDDLGIKKASANGETDEPPSNCGLYELVSKHKRKFEKISCVPHKPSLAACRFAEELYGRDDSLKSCGYSRTVDICRTRENTVSRYDFHCSLKDCAKYARKDVKLWIPDEKGETIITQGVYDTEDSLQKAVNYFANLSSIKGQNYLFLECTDGNSERQPFDVISQFLILPPLELQRKPNSIPSIQKNNSKININIVLLDSVARSHFFRSLPTVIETFNSINKDASFPAEILDFELFQALEGHTAENLHALFTGTLFPEEWNGADRERASLDAGKLFGKFADAGYRNFYQDDLCYSDWWGLRMDMGSPASWEDFLKTLEDNHIEHTGLTASSCKILAANNVTNPFTGPEGPWCFNGRFHDAYYLDFTLSRHFFASKHGVPLITYSALNVGHEHIGKRIQSIDTEMVDYVKNIASLSNTLTILLSDHGNTYTRYTHAIMEGRFEQFHPSLFLILPNGVRDRVGENILDNLRANQKKIVTMLDIHDAIVNIPGELKETGLFGKISGKRTCDDLDLRLPNLCVCEGWDAPTWNSSAQVGLVDFAVGQLNNIILRYQSKIRARKIIPRCKRLVPTEFSNVRERNRGGTLITTFDFKTKAGMGSHLSHDVFHVELQSDIDPKQTSLEMKLLNFDRISKYGHYRACGDKRMDMRLCVCDIGSKPERIPIESFILRELSIEKSKLAPSNVEITHKHQLSKCLYFKVISIPELPEKSDVFSVSYEVANVCNKDLAVQATFDLNNMKTSQVAPMKKLVPANGITYIGGAMRDVPYWGSKVESYDITLVPRDAVS